MTPGIEGYKRNHQYGIFNRKGESMGLYATRKQAEGVKLLLQKNTGECFRIAIVE